jgi:hypothetical protein
MDQHYAVIILLNKNVEGGARECALVTRKRIANPSLLPFYSSVSRLYETYP